MSTGQIIRFILEALVFAAWAYMVYRTVTTLREREEAAGKGGGGGMVAQFKAWLKNEGDQQDRKTVFFLTFVLAAMLAMNILLPQ